MTALAPLSPLIGRDTERDEIERALSAGARLCTLVGPGGIGKTRLAQEICARIDGVFCDLSAANTRAEALATIATTLDLRANDRDVEALVAQSLAAAPPSVLVLDNLEQLTESIATLVRAWLNAQRNLSVLATSRERLGIDGEELFVIEPLSTTARGALSPAAELFARRARAQGARSISDAEAEAVAGAVEGVPLAIELAAARAKSLGISSLIDAREGLLDALRSVRRDAPSRHETLRRTIDWSWHMLTEPERSAFAACGSFRGPFDHAACCAVLDDDPRRASLLAQTLVERSLLRALDDGRFALFETLRAYALEKLVESASLARVAERHRTFFADRASRAHEAFERNASAENLAAIERDRDNLALVAKDTEHPRDALAALVALDPLALYPNNDSLRANALRARGRARLHRGSLSLAREDFDAAHALAISLGERSLAAQLSVELGVLAQQRRSLDEALAHYRSARQSALEADDALLLARVAANIAAVDHDRGELERAADGYRSALSMLASLDEPRIEGITRSNFALVLLEQRALAPRDAALREQAERQFDRASALLEASGDRRLFAINEGNRGLLAHESGRLVAAQEANARAAELLAMVGDVRSEGLCRARLGSVLAERGQLDAARRELARAEALLERADDRLGLDALALHRALLALCEARRELDASGDRSRWSAETERVRALLSRTTADAEGARSLSDDVRIAATIVARALDDNATVREHTPSATRPRNALVVGPETMWFRIDDHPVQDLRAYGPLRRVLDALIDARSQGRPLSIEDVFSAGWPGEKAIASAASNRVHVTLSELRRRGLRPWLIQRDGRYALSDMLDVERSEATFSEPAARSRRGQRPNKERN